MIGIDFRPHSQADAYREAVNFLKHDPLSLGALVTTHKIDLYTACRDLFDEIDLFARVMGETSCLSKRDGRLTCHAKDPISSGLALDGFLPADHFARTGAEVFSMGAGGSTIALTWHLMQRDRGGTVSMTLMTVGLVFRLSCEYRGIHYPNRKVVKSCGADELAERDL